MLNFTSTMHFHHEALELVLIIKPMGLLKGANYEIFTNSE